MVALIAPLIHTMLLIPYRHLVGVDDVFIACAWAERAIASAPGNLRLGNTSDNVVTLGLPILR